MGIKVDFEIHKAYVRHGVASAPCRDEKVAFDETEAPKSPSKTGCGSKIPTCYRVHFNGRWRRVYATCFNGSVMRFYIPSGEDKLTVSFY